MKVFIPYAHSNGQIIVCSISTWKPDLNNKKQLAKQLLKTRVVRTRQTFTCTYVLEEKEAKIYLLKFVNSIFFNRVRINEANNYGVLLLKIKRWLPNSTFPQCIFCMERLYNVCDVSINVVKLVYSLQSINVYNLNSLPRRTYNATDRGKYMYSYRALAVENKVLNELSWLN